MHVNYHLGRPPNSTRHSEHPLMLTLSNCIKHHTISVMAISFGMQRPMYIHCGQVVYTAQVEERNFGFFEVARTHTKVFIQLCMMYSLLQTEV